MGLFDGLAEIIDPHVREARAQIALHAQSLDMRLQGIEKQVSNLGRGNFGDKWQRFVIKRKFTENETYEVGVCPINEIWSIQAIATDGVQEKSPSFIIMANGVLLETVNKEGLGYEGIGGNQVVLPGERLEVLARAEGNINCVITVIRMKDADVPLPTEYGRSSEQFSPKATHEIARDEIASRTDQYTEPAPAVAATEGHRG